MQASYRDFLETSRNVNCLDNPLAGGVPAPVQLATDLRAAVSLYQDFPSHIPVRLMTWGLLAKADAVHHPHIDRPGTATFIAQEDGLKKWDLGFPPNATSEEEVAIPAAYGAEMTEKRNYARGWQWYSILLHPGSMLCVSLLIHFSYTDISCSFMRPGTLHSVTTLTDSISIGGHFFSAPTIKHSVYSIYHIFVGSASITNVSTDNEQEMLLRIILFWHHEMVEQSSQYLKRISNCGEGELLFMEFHTEVNCYSLLRFHSTYSQYSQI